VDGNQDGALTASPAFVELRGLERRFDGVAAVAGVSLGIRRGEILAILGPSGCGKSTLLRLIAGFEEPDAGEIRIEGQSMAGLPPYRRPVNTMFQSYALFPHMTVAQNVAFGLKQDSLSAQQVSERTTEALALVRMEQHRDRRPEQLSGGQQQRAALARSLAKSPKLLLLDEPMAALDRQLRAEMQFELAEIIRRVRVTCVLVTHDQEEAMAMADRLALMRDGELVQTGSPADVYAMPNCRFSAEFLGEVNLFNGQLGEAGDGQLVFDTPDLSDSIEVAGADSLPAGTDCSLAVRPEKIVLSDAPLDQQYISREAIVEDFAFLGGRTRYHLRLASGRTITAVSPESAAASGLTHGQPIEVGWRIRDAVLLADG